MISTDRRSQPRITLRRYAEVCQRNEATGERIICAGAATDISEGGIRFRGRQLFDPFRKIEVRFALGEAMIEAKGRVRHLTFNSRGHVIMGIKFLDMRQEDREFIEQYCHGMSSVPR